MNLTPRSLHKTSTQHGENGNDRQSLRSQNGCTLALQIKNAMIVATATKVPTAPGIDQSAINFAMAILSKASRKFRERFQRNDAGNPKTPIALRSD